MDLGIVENLKIDEASGIASSKNNSHLVWVHNDSGDLPKIYGVGMDGSHQGSLRLKGILARDWEDMCIGPGPEKNIDFLYVGYIEIIFQSLKRRKYIDLKSL